MTLWQKFTKLSFNQKITISLAFSSVVVALGSLAVAGIAAWIAADSREMKAAIARLGVIAEQSQNQTERLAAQNRITSDQLAEQRLQTVSLSSQAEAAEQQSANFAKELLISRELLEVQARGQRVYEDQAKLATTDVIQRYRRLTLLLQELQFPEEVGARLRARIRIQNDGDAPLTLEDLYSTLAVIPKGEAYSDQAFKSFDSSPRKQARVNVPPGSGFEHTIGLPVPVDARMIYAVNHLGANVVVVAQVIYLDPLGNVHREYLCAYSNVDKRNQLCQTPPND
jgi:hypothetical protein